MRVRGVRGGGERGPARGRAVQDVPEDRQLRDGTELDGVRLVRRFIAVIDGWILNLPMRAIGALTGISPGTVRKYWRRLDAMGRGSSRGWTQRERSRSD